ncbi:MAG: undecaprenyl-diphosphatase UppP, partial [Pirellulales bacterium]
QTVELWVAILLGVVQGLTEFLPISSTAHLRIVPALIDKPDPGAAFSAVIQIGTLVAVLAYFRRDIFRIGVAWFTETGRGQIARSHDGRMGWMMIVATLPIVVLGLAFKDMITGELRSLYVIAYALIGLALLLIVAERYVLRRAARGVAAKTLDDVGWFEAIVVGFAQAVALVPGASRSGVTITGGLFLGLSRETAARFSFLLSLPAVFAAGIYELFKERHELLASTADATNLLVATVVSGIVGYAAIAALLRYLRSRTTYVFVVYRIALGLLLLGLLAAGKIDPMR